MGALLRSGRSQEVLNEISRTVASQGRSIEEISPRLAFLVAFAYQHQRDLDQSLAWLGLTSRKASRLGELSGRVNGETRRLLSTLPQPVFDRYTDRWHGDPLIGPLFDRERVRRAQGGLPSADVSLAWFGVAPGASGQGWDSLGTVGTHTAEYKAGEITLGVLLPFTGKFASYAANIKNGIELAVSRYAGSAKLTVVYGDSLGEAEVASNEYQKLVEQGASVVLGPLLVKDSESVAARSRSLGVPFITFTKKRGVPELGPEVFRLGATAEDQMRELVSYAATSKSLKSFAILYPDNESGNELREAFIAEVQRQRGSLTFAGRYVPGDQSSMEGVVAKLRSSNPQAVLIADSLDGAQPIVERLRANGGENITLLGAALWNDPALLRGFGSLLDGSVFVAPFFGASSNPVVSAFSEGYREKYGAFPDLLSAQGFDAANFVLNQTDSQDNSPATLIKRLSAAAPFDGVTGKLTVNNVGDLNRRMSVLAVQSGEVVEVMAGGTLTGFFHDGEKENKPNTTG
jgi:ABC-type branched-subunit amino acid transport system substrate-binding protein